MVVGRFAGLAFAALVMGTPVSAYQVHDLTSIAIGAGYGTGYAPPYVSGLNNRGTVVGYGSGTLGFFTLTNGQLAAHQLIPYTYDPSNPHAPVPQTHEIAFDINDKNRVLGIATFNHQPDSLQNVERRGFVWFGGGVGSNGSFEWLSGDGTGTLPFSFSNAGRVVGVGRDAVNPAFGRLKTTVADSGVGWTSLAPLPSHSHSIAALGQFANGARIVNDNAQIVGMSCASPCIQPQHVVWNSGIPQALTGGQNYSLPRAINKAGDIVGVIDDRAVVWKGNTPQQLGNLRGLPDDYSRAEAVNDYGHIVGQSKSFNEVMGSSAFIWKNGQMTDLNALYALPEGFWATSAVSINNRGQVIVIGERFLGDGSGEARNFAISPGQTPRVPVVQPGIPDQAFSARVALVPGSGVIGRVSGSDAGFTLVRPSGEQIVYLPGERPQVRFGDRITTGQGTVGLSFNDNSQFSIGPQASLQLDEYVYDPNPSASQTRSNASLLRALFVFTSGLIYQPPYPVNPNDGIGNLGIRGDAADYIRPDLLDVAVKMNVGSPVSLSTFVQLSGAPFELSFEYVFLTGTGTLDVYFEDLQVGSFAATLDDMGRFRQARLLITDTDVLAMPDARLSFIFDGPAGAQMLIDDVSMPGLTIGGFDVFDTGWFKDGPGSLELVATISETAYAQITAVPEPEVWALLAAGLVLVVVRSRRHAAIASRNVEI